VEHLPPEAVRGRRSVPVPGLEMVAHGLVRRPRPALAHPEEVAHQVEGAAGLPSGPGHLHGGAAVHQQKLDYLVHGAIT